MIVGILLLTLAYAGLAALLLNLNLATRYGALLKTAAIVLVTSLYAATWYGHRALTGWASAEALPEQFRVHWIVIDEPDKTGNGEGALYLWVQELDSAGLPAGPPRAHELPWSATRARASQEALERLAAGERLNGAVVTRADNVAGEDDGPVPVAPSGLEFSRVPPPALPPKGPP